MPWYKRPDGSMSGEDKNEDIEFKPEKLKEDITKDFGEKLTAMQTAQDEKMKPLLDMASQLAADRKEREEAAKKAAEKKTSEDSTLTSEDFMLDPVDAIRRAQQPVAKATMMLAARMATKDTLEGKEYYHGEFKTQVDALVASMSLEQQMNPASIENCYKIAFADNYKAISEGKIKARTASSQFDSTGTGGHNGGDKTDTFDTLTKEEEHMAKTFGMTNEQWAKSKKELEYV